MELIKILQKDAEYITIYDSDEEINSNVAQESDEEIKFTDEWTEHEDTQLINSVNEYGAKNWHFISEIIMTKSHEQWEKRWDYILRTKNEPKDNKITDADLVDYYISVTKNNQNDVKSLDDLECKDVAHFENLRGKVNDQYIAEEDKNITVKEWNKINEIKNEDKPSFNESINQLSPPKPILLSDIDKFELYVRKWNVSCFKQKYEDLIQKNLYNTQQTRKFELSDEMLLIQLYDRYGPEWLLFTTFFQNESSFSLKLKFYRTVKKYYYLYFKEENKVDEISANIQKALIEFYNLPIDFTKFKSDNDKNPEIVSLSNSNDDELINLLWEENKLLKRQDLEYKLGDEQNPFFVSFIPILLSVLSIDVSSLPNEVKYNMDGFIEFFKSYEYNTDLIKSI